jgi:hypothetical protein
MAAESRKLFYAPTALTAEVVRDVLSVVCIEVSLEIVAQWTPLELLVAYDFAIRGHLRASDSAYVRRRDQPWFVTTAQTMSKATPNNVIASIPVVPGTTYDATAQIIPDPDQPGHNIGMLCYPVPITQDIALTGPGEISGHYRKDNAHPILRATGAQQDVSLTFFEEPLRKLGVTRIELANYSAPCAGFSEFAVELRIVARGSQPSIQDPLYLHADGTVCTHDFRPPEAHMFGEWEPS